MSYTPQGKPVQGQKELLDDDWSQSSAGLQNQQFVGSQGPSPIRHLQTEGQHTPTRHVGQLMHPDQNNHGQQQYRGTSPTNQASRPLMEPHKQLTQEDYLFIRDIEKRYFISRVIPISCAISGLVYIYNTMKKRPHAIKHYIFTPFAVYLLGRFTYKTEIKRQIENSTLNTPVMQLMREKYGLRSQSDVSGSSELYPVQGFDNWSPTAANKPVSNFDNQPQPGSSYRPLYPVGQPNPQHGGFAQEFDNQQDGQSRQPVTYEELRARNRGYNR